MIHRHMMVGCQWWPAAKASSWARLAAIMAKWSSTHSGANRWAGPIPFSYGCPVLKSKLQPQWQAMKAHPCIKYIPKLHYTALHNFGFGVQVCKASTSGAGRAAHTCKHKICQDAAKDTALLHGLALLEHLLNSDSSQNAAWWRNESCTSKRSTKYRQEGHLFQFSVLAKAWICKRATQCASCHAGWSDCVTTTMQADKDGSMRPAV